MKENERYGYLIGDEIHMLTVLTMFAASLTGTLLGGPALGSTVSSALAAVVIKGIGRTKG